jgi:hypothetical protein
MDSRERTWRWYKDGTPVDPNAADQTPSRTIDPTTVKPPDVSEPAEVGKVSELASTSSAAELERLARSMSEVP